MCLHLCWYLASYWHSLKSATYWLTTPSSTLSFPICSLSQLSLAFLVGCGKLMWLNVAIELNQASALTSSIKWRAFFFFFPPKLLQGEKTENRIFSWEVDFHFFFPFFFFWSLFKSLLKSSIFLLFHHHFLSNCYN